MYLCILLFSAIAFIKDTPQRFQNQLWLLAPVLDSGNGIFQRCTWLEILCDPLIFRNISKDRVKKKEIETLIVFLLIYFLFLFLIFSFFLFSLSLSQAGSHKTYAGKASIVMKSIPMS